MPRVGFVRFQLRHIHGNQRLPNQRALGLRCIEPDLQIIWHELWQPHGLCQRPRRCPCSAHQLLQGSLCDAQIVFGSDFLGAHQVKPCLRFA